MVSRPPGRGLEGGCQRRLSLEGVVLGGAGGRLTVHAGSWPCPAPGTHSVVGEMTSELAPGDLGPGHGGGPGRVILESPKRWPHYGC